MAKEIPKRKIKMLAGSRARVGGVSQQVLAGKPYEVDGSDAKILVEMGKAVYVETKQPKPSQKQLPGANPASGDAGQAGDEKKPGGDLEAGSGSGGENPGQDLQLTEIPHGIIIPGEVSTAVAVAGFDTPEKILAAADEDLQAVHGVGPATMADLRTLAQLVLDARAQQDNPDENPDAKGNGGRDLKTET